MRRSTLLIALVVLALVAGPPGAWFAAQREARLVALRSGDGRVAWSSALESAGDHRRALPYRLAAGGGSVIVNVVLDGDSFGGRGDEVRVIAFDARGDRTWEFAPSVEEFGTFLAADTAWVAPLIADDVVYVTLSMRADRIEAPVYDRLVALDAATGRVRWTFAPIARRHTDRLSPAVPAGRLVIVPTHGDAGLALQALDAGSGAPVWRAELGDIHLASPATGPVVAAAGGRVVALTERGVFAFDTEIGARRYATEDGSPYGQLWLDDDALYVGGAENRSIVAMDAATGAHRWTFRPDGLDGSLRAFRAVGDAVYTLCTCRTEGERLEGAHLIAIDAGTGRERWRTPPRRGLSQLAGVPTFAPGLVVMADDIVTAIDAADGSVRWQSPNVRAGASADGTLVFTTRTAPRWRHWLAYLHPGWAGEQ